MWTFEQEQSFAFTNVATVVRMTVVKLKSGGLWVYAPIAATRYAERHAHTHFCTGERREGVDCLILPVELDV